jgi:hypothetical protein
VGKIKDAIGTLVGQESSSDEHEATSPSNGTAERGDAVVGADEHQRRAEEQMAKLTEVRERADQELEQASPERREEIEQKAETRDQVSREQSDRRAEVIAKMDEPGGPGGDAT